MSLESHWPLAFGLLLIAAFGSWVFIHSNRSYLLRWAVIPASLVVAVASAKVYDGRLGYALPSERLPAHFVYLGHHVVMDRARKAAIEVWAGTGDTRLYRVPYSKPMEKTLEQAREQARGGMPVMVERRGGTPPRAAGSPGPSSAASESYEARVIMPWDVAPKKG